MHNDGKSSLRAVVVSIHKWITNAICPCQFCLRVLHWDAQNSLKNEKKYWIWTSVSFFNKEEALQIKPHECFHSLQGFLSRLPLVATMRQVYERGRGFKSNAFYFCLSQILMLHRQMSTVWDNFPMCMTHPSGFVPLMVGIYKHKQLTGRAPCSLS